MALLWLFCCFRAEAQTSIVITGRDNWGNYVRLHHIVIENQTQGWRDTLFYPDTVYIPSEGEGVAEYNHIQGLSLSQNVPNPFDGTTEFMLSISYEDQTSIEVLDMAGRRVAYKSLYLQPGTHAFQVWLNTPQQYILNVRTAHEQASIKMVNNGSSSGFSIAYNGKTLADIQQKYLRNGGFEEGDLLRIIGYRQSGETYAPSDTVEITTLTTEPVFLPFNLCDWLSPTDSVNIVTLDVTDITRTSAVCSGEVVWEGVTSVTERGICWDTLPAPSIESSYAPSGAGTGAFSVTLSELIPETEYYYRAYAITPCGMVYGDTASFTSGAYQVPTVTTDSATNITDTSAILSGTVTDNGGLPILEQGFCWGDTASTPYCTATLSNQDTFSHSLTGLDYSTHYYARSYATNARGTGYGDVIEFTTDTLPPEEAIVVTGEVTDITRTSAVCSGEVVWEGISSVIERGICWDTLPIPSVETTNASSGAGIGSFSVTLSELIPETEYYYRAYAITPYDTVYGESVLFTSGAYTVPTVTTDSVIDITDTSAISFGAVIDDGGLPIWNRGFLLRRIESGTSTLIRCLTDQDTFSLSLVDLRYATHYSIRAYAINERYIGYGNLIEFTTDTILPEVTSDTITDIGSSYATFHGTLVSDGGDPSTVVGLCWSSSPNPTNTDNHIEWDGTLGTFNRIIGGIHDSICYVRAYATNTIGTVYGDVLSFVPDTMPTSVHVSLAHLDHDYATMRVTIVCDSTTTNTDRGLWFDTVPQPNLSGADYAATVDDDTFYIHIGNLERASTYYMRGHCISRGELVYSDDYVLLTFAEDGQPCIGTPTLTDWEGHTYNTVQVGAQCWMKSNLYTTYFPDGTPIPYGQQTYNQTSMDEPYYYRLTYDTNWLPSYGHAYNWKALTNKSTNANVNSQGICPNGWHVPDDSEWMLLRSYTGAHYACGDDSTSVAKALADVSGWNTSTVNCSPGAYPANNNLTGFSAFPAGGHMDNNFYINQVAYLWSRSNQYPAFDTTSYYSYGHVFKLSYNVISLSYSSYNYNRAFPVRCVKNDL